MYKDTLAWGDKVELSNFCKKGNFCTKTLLQEQTVLHRDGFARCFFLISFNFLIYFIFLQSLSPLIFTLGWFYFLLVFIFLIIYFILILICFINFFFLQFFLVFIFCFFFVLFYSRAKLTVGEKSSLCNFVLVKFRPISLQGTEN